MGKTCTLEGFAESKTTGNHPKNTPVYFLEVSLGDDACDTENHNREQRNYG